MSVGHIKTHFKSQHKMNGDIPDLRHALAATDRFLEKVNTILITLAEINYFKLALIY